MNVIPKPKTQIICEGSFKFDDKVFLKSEIEGAQEIIERYLSFASEKNEDAQQAIYVKKIEDLKQEAYILDIEEKAVVISASNLKGVFYAVMTILQLSGIAANENNEMQCCQIIDEPRFGYRGFMLDEARHFFGKAFVKKTLDMMALIKLNVFHWHLTDDQGWRVEIKKYPLLTQKGTTRKSTQLNLIDYDNGNEKHDDKPYGDGFFYTQEDIKEIVAYAQKRNIEIIPEIDMPGHLTAAAACYPELTCTGEKLEVSDRWGIMETIGCAGKQELYDFVFDVIDELAELFPSEYFHIGGDEVPKKRWKTCPKCQEKIKQLGLKDEEELQGAFNLTVMEHLKSKGKKMIGWNEILKAQNISDDTIVQWWVNDCRENGVYDWVKKGNKIIMTYVDYVYMDYFYSHHDLRKCYIMDYDTVGLPEEQKDGIIGVEAPMWTEYVRSEGKFNFNVYPRMHAIAETGWTAKELKDFDDFSSRVNAFEPIFKNFGIVPAPERYYRCEGEDGKHREEIRDEDWKNDPNTEYLNFLKEENR